MPADTDDSGETEAAEAEPMAAVPTDIAVTADNIAAISLVFILVFFILHTPLKLLSFFFCDYTIAPFPATNNMQYTPGL